MQENDEETYDCAGESYHLDVSLGEGSREVVLFLCVDDPSGVECGVDIASAGLFAGAFNIHLRACCSLGCCCAVAEAKHRCVDEGWFRNCCEGGMESKMGMRKCTAQV